MNRKKAIKLITYMDGNGQSHRAGELLDLMHRHGLKENRLAVVEIGTKIQIMAMYHYDLDAVKRVRDVFKRYLR